MSLDLALTADSPVFIGRMGGSDTDAIAAMIAAGVTSEAAGVRAALDHLPTVKRFNGYYDHAGDESNYFRYLDVLRQSYAKSKNLALVDSKLLTLYFPDNLNEAHHAKDINYEPGFKALVSEIDGVAGPWCAYPYTFFQTLRGRQNLFRVFEKSLIGRRIVVASPFGASIRENWPNRHRFFKDYAYPNFSVEVLETPITYDGLPKNFYPHQNWFETLDALKEQLGRMDFDIVLLSCGSYAQPLGLYARDELGRKAVYVGGVLQLFFGIMGRRYENPFFLDYINSETFISPVERQTFFDHVTVSSGAAKEAFGAYF